MNAGGHLGAESTSEPVGLGYADALTLRSRLIGLPLPDGVDRARYHALLTAGVRDVLLQELDALASRRAAAKNAAVQVSAAADWAAVAKRVRDRDQARRSGAYIERVSR